MNPQLLAIGDALERAVTADLERERSRRRSWRSPKAGVALIAITMVAPVVAYAANNLLTNRQVAAGLPQGTRALIGTHPTCVAVRADVEYRCVLASAPANPAVPTTGKATRTSAPLSGPVKVAVMKTDGHIVVIAARTAPALRRRIAALGGVRRWVLIPAGRRRVRLAATRTASATFTWTGTDEATVDATKHVNGGCRALNATGTVWECYIGETAVRQQIISQSFLGTHAPTPGVG